MSMVIGYAVAAVLLALTVPWCLRMLRTTTTEPALNRIGQLVAMAGAAAMVATIVRLGVTPAWTWYPTAVAVGVGAIALSVRWPTVVRSGPADRTIRTVVSLVVEGTLLVLLLYGFLR